VVKHEASLKQEKAIAIEEDINVDAVYHSNAIEGIT